MSKYSEMCQTLESNFSKYLQYREDCCLIFNSLRYYLISYLGCEASELVPIDQSKEIRYVEKAMYINDEIKSFISFSLKFDVPGIVQGSRLELSHELKFEVKKTILLDATLFELVYFDTQDVYKIDDISKFQNSCPDDMAIFIEKIYLHIKPKCESVFKAESPLL